MSASERSDEKEVSQQSSTRRQRAPTITIDTSAVNSLENSAESHQMQALSPPASHGEPGHQPSNEREPAPTSTSNNYPAELRASHSFDSRDSRPTSPHNISSPTAKMNGQQHNFLSVPTARSRGNSVDSEDVAVSPGSYGGETFIPSADSSQNGEVRPAHTTQSQDHLLPDDEALKPDPGTEADFEMPDNRFAFSPGQLNKMLNPKSLGAFHALGGLKGLEKGLRSDRNSGLSVDEVHLDGTVSFREATAKPVEDGDKVHQTDEFGPPREATTEPSTKNDDDSFADRKRVYSDNRLPDRKSKSIWELAWLAYNDKVLILLTAAAVISLALGIYQAVRPNEPDRTAWVEGVAIVVAIVIVVAVGAGNDWQKERQFVKLNRKKDDRVIKVIRSGKSREISVYDVLVGDVVHLEPGDMIPVDGIFISGHNVTCDESSATGESDLLRKTSGDTVFNAIESHESLNKLDPFIMSGGKVTEGVGTFMVTSTGINSSFGKTMMSLQEDPQTTPLQAKLNVLAEYIAKLGLSAGLILFVVTFIQFLVRYFYGRLENYSPDHVAQDFLQIFITAVTIIVVAVPEGLPLAVTLALAFATTRMLRDNNLVRQLRACETMGNATTICSDKTGTLTQNKMSVVAGTIGLNLRFTENHTKGMDATTDSPVTPKEIELSSDVSETSAAEVVKTLADEVKNILRESIALNSTAFEGESDGQETFIGSKTETAMLLYARDHLGMDSLAGERANADVVQAIPFDSKRKCMATVISMPSGKHRVYVKGASEILLAQCRNVVADPTKDLAITPLTEESEEALNQIITTYASRSLRTIGMVYRDFDEWPPQGLPTERDNPKAVNFDNVFQNMTFLGIVGIKDPLRVGVADAVKACQKAGVFVRMVTGDNITTAKAIAEDCGIFTPGGIVLEGPQFRKMTRAQMNQTIPRLQVLARSSPDDKRILVKRLRELGETVAVTGDGTNDAPALKTADVGFSMGIAGTEVAKEASAIILMDDNFASIVKAMMWGRAVNDAVQKFLQFQITVNITAVLLAFISAVSSPNQTSVITAVQLLWVNLIMDTFAALALATDPPTPSILDRKPQPKSAPLITLTMWKMIIGQSIYQLIVTLTLYYTAGSGQIFPGIDERRKASLIFNAFVWMQVFNQYNARRLDNKFNIFEGIQRNFFFIGIQFIICGAQVLIIFVGGEAFSVQPLNGPEWAASIIIGLISMLIAIFIRLIPDDFVRRLIPAYFVRKATPQLLVSDEERSYAWNPALEDIKADLEFLKLIRGGRLNILKYKLQHPRELLPRSRSGSRSRTNSVPRTPVNDQPNSESGGTPAPPTPDSRRSLQRRRGRSRSNSAFGPAAAMAGIVAGSIGGWSPIDRRGDDLARFPLQNRSDLEGRAGVEVHPDTRPDDPVLASPDPTGKAPSQVPETRPSFDENLASGSGRDKPTES